MPEGAVASGKLAQSRARRRARARAARDVRRRAARSPASSARRGDFAVVNSGYNDYRVEGQKTVAFELLEELGRVPDVVALPYGGGGNSTAIVRGFREAGEGHAAPARRARRRSARRPRRRRSASPIPSTARRSLARSRSRRQDRDARREEALSRAWRDLATREGIFCEPASAAGIAGLRAAAASSRGSLVVCIVTGHGLKDADAAPTYSPEPTPVDADAAAVARAAMLARYAHQPCSISASPGPTFGAP